MPSPPSSPPDIRDAFARLWFSDPSCHSLTWHGIHIHKNPFDLFLYQQLLFAQRPDTIIEVGASVGGSTLFFAHMLDLLGHGRIISIDRSAQWDPQVLAHPRVSTFVGDSLDFRAPLSPNNFVILDGDHSETHVSAELDLYSQLIPIGGNLIVEDTIINHPFPIYESSPWEAVDTFLLSHPNWTITEDATRLHFSFANHGFLRRLS